MATSSTGAVAAAAAAEERKQAKYANLSQGYSFTPVAIETLGAIGPKSLAFLKDLGRRIFQQLGESKAIPYLLQCLSVAMQQGNSAAIMGTLDC